MHIAASQPAILASLLRLSPVAAQRAVSVAAPRDAAEPPVPAAGPVVPAGASVQMLVAIAASAPDATRRRAVATADKGLRALDRLDRGLRLGEPVGGALDDMAERARRHDVPANPAAARLVAEVELRVLVELARFGMVR